MAQSWTEIMTRAVDNSRSAATQLEEVQKKREKLKAQPSQPANVNNQAIAAILERRRKEQELDVARLKSTNGIKKTVSTGNIAQKSAVVKKESAKTETNKDTTKPVKHSNGKVKVEPVSFQDIMKAAELNAMGKPLPKDLRARIESQKVKTIPEKSTTSVSNVKAEPMKSNGTKSTGAVSSASQPKTAILQKKRASSLPMTKTTTNQKSNNDLNKPKTSSASSTSNSVKKPVSIKPTTLNVKAESSKVKLNPSNNKISANQIKPTINSSKPSNNSVRPTINTNKPTNNSIRPSSNPTKPTVTVPVLSNNNRPSLPNGNRMVLNGNQNRMISAHRRGPIIQPKKRTIIDTDDEDDEDLRDFIVDDDEDGCDYEKELHETLRKNFRFDPKKYRGRTLDDDDDDLANMESSFDQIEREEEYSRRMGLKEDIDDVLREEAEKKKRLMQAKKRAKTS